jgi:uncharacterized protein YbjT (DUF2867 family)
MRKKNTGVYLVVRVHKKMKRILVTGATGNIGSEVIHYLSKLDSEVETVAAVRNVDKGKIKFAEYPNLSFRQFDFENTATFKSAFNKVDILFLLRPPHISKVDIFFRPLLNSAKKNGIKNLVFLSVQGAEKNRVIPHNKIEHLIVEFGFNYIFVRPSYFMQNLTTTLLSEILNNKSITLPSGNAKFNWIDTKNIGEASAHLLSNFDNYQKKSFEITGTENKNFREVSRLITEIIGEKIRYNSINPISFYIKKRKEDIESGFAMVMAIIHFLPRFQSEPQISKNYQLLTGKVPTTLRDFIIREKEKIMPTQQKL